MSQAEVELVRETFERVNRGEYAESAQLLADDVELVVPSSGFLNAGAFSGRRAVERWFMDWFSTFGLSAHFDLRELVDAGDQVVVTAHHTARGGASGIATETDVHYVYGVRDGKVRRIEFFGARDAARAAAGLAGESDIDKLRRGYERFNAEDFSALRDLLDPAIVAERGVGDDLVGADAVIAWLEPDAFAWQQMEPLEIRQCGDRILVRLRLRARGRSSAIELDQIVFHVWTVRDGRAVHVTGMPDEAEALARFEQR